MLHIEKLMGMNNKETCTRVYKRVCVGIDLRVYTKYTRLICICVVRIYLSWTVVFHHVNVSFETPIVYQFPSEIPTELLSVIIPVKYVISKSKLS